MRILNTNERNRYIRALNDRLISIGYEINDLKRISARAVGAKGDSQYYNQTMNRLIGEYIGLFKQYMDTLEDRDKADFGISTRFGRYSATRFLQELLCKTAPPVLIKKTNRVDNSVVFEDSGRKCKDLINGIGQGYRYGVQQLPDTFRRKVYRAVIANRTEFNEKGPGYYIVQTIKDGRLTTFKGLERIEVYNDGAGDYMEEQFQGVREDFPRRLER